MVEKATCWPTSAEPRVGVGEVTEGAEKTVTVFRDQALLPEVPTAVNVTEYVPGTVAVQVMLT